jgi:TusA-related sulfurtransferase
VSLRDRIELLYGTLDANLVFHPPEEKANPVQVLTMTNEMENKMTEKNSQKEASNDQIDAQLDLGGVACPMNFVKAKMKLERMQAGERLELILDEGSPIENVPVSLKNEGHEVGEIKELGNGRWRVVIKKQD